jgi:hypothetical protein
MLRTTGLHLLLGGILRFSTPGHPGALGACYVALWRLPRPDLHRLADGDLQGTPRLGSARDVVGREDFPTSRRLESLPLLALQNRVDTLARAGCSKRRNPRACHSDTFHLHLKAVDIRVGQVFPRLKAKLRLKGAKDEGH